ncbi:MAG: sugar phosphate isomerase/epimerase [Planctomycetaceae bacterium]|nr:sugar phosphate isomerase/epimerase [Planctomycetaceae bacterium]
MNSTRRMALQAIGAGALVLAGNKSGAARGAAASITVPRNDSPFRYCLNMSTIRGQKPTVDQEVEIAAKAGFNGIEPWIPNLRKFVEDGGKLADLGKKISDLGLTVDSAIGFAQWIVDDEKARANGLEEAKRDMDMLRQIGGTRIAAPPVGAHGGDAPKIDLDAAAERYAALQKVGDDCGVLPQLEVWGFSKNLSRLGEVAYVAASTGHAQTLLLLDAYHLYKGGSDFAGLDLFSDESLQVFHINDYPAAPPREQMNDSHRVYPGDGIAPMTQILKSLGGKGRSITLSLELFNPDYWKQDAQEVANTGLAKMKAVVAAAEKA